MFRFVLALCVAIIGGPAMATGLTGEFPSIDGGTLSIEDWRGQPVLIVNTASRCGFTYQYEGLQRIHDKYAEQGLVVLAVPSDDFRQELKDAEAVKNFCELNYGLTIPMTDITHVRGQQAHPFYKAVKAETGFEPKWNFHKILLAPDGNVAATWGSATRPDSRAVTQVIEGYLD